MKLLWLLPALLAAQPKPVTLEQLLSAPFPSELHAAPAGGSIAWVQNAQGAGNIWVAAAPDYAARAITTYTGDAGKEITALTWTADASAIIYVRDEHVWTVPAAGGSPKDLGEGSAPAVNPKGGRVAFLKDGRVWSAPLDGSAKAEPLFTARGKSASLRWSPDGSALAFVSDRDNHSFVGIYNPAARTVKFADPSLDKDSEPAWSPDGKQIAFLRQPSVKDQNLFTPRRAADPWSIRVADAASGQGKAVFTADPARGSAFHEVVAENQILWTSSGQLVFPWERDGWTHLYSIAAAGQGSARLLTFGDFEVEHVTLSADGKEVLYSANSDDIDRRHLFRVPVAGGPVTPLTSGKGIEWSPVMTSDGKAIAFLRSDAKMPARAALMQAFGTPKDLLPLDFPGDSLVEPQAVTISAADGMKIKGQLFLPPGNAAEKKPAVIFFHGGSRRQMLLGWHYMPYYHNAYAFNQYLASKGYVVLSVNYRSGIGYGMEFREALNFGAAGASEFNDVLGAGLFLQARADVDPRRIGLWGGSYGGYLTALGLARASDLFCAGVNIHGVYDWNVAIKNFNPGYNALERPEAAKLAFDSSPIASIGRWKSPVLLIHGDDDRNVPFSESVMLAEGLRKQGVEYEMLVFPDEIHNFVHQASWLDLFRASADFLDRRVKGRK